MVNDMEWLLISAVLSGVSQQEWPAVVSNRLRDLGRTLMQDGAPVTDEGMRRRLLVELTSKLEARVEFFRRMGAL
jgi:hypothetical protein